MSNSQMSEEQGVNPSHDSIYITDLSRETEEHHLYHLFKKFGPIKNVHVRRNPISKASLGSALVTFEQGCKPDTIQKALDAMNYTHVHGKPVRVMRHLDDPEERKALWNGAGNLFVKNLTEWMSSMALHQLFQRFGHILSCKVVTAENGDCKGYGYVNFETTEAAQAAVKNLHGMMVNGKNLYVTRFVPKEAGGQPKSRMCELYVRGLEPQMDSNALQVMFKRFGAVRNAVVCRDGSGKSRCFGFVTFYEEEGARVAIEAVDGQLCGKMQLHVEYAQEKGLPRKMGSRNKSESDTWIKKPPPHSHQHRNGLHEGNSFKVGTPGYSIIVHGLHPKVNDSMLDEEFGGFGKVLAARVIRDQYGSSTGMAVIGFSEEIQATSAMLQMNGKLLGGQQLSVSKVDSCSCPRGSPLNSNENIIRSNRNGNHSTPDRW